MFGKLAGVLCAAVLVTACDRSPVAPTMRATSENHVEPPGVLSAPDTGERGGTRENHVEPPGVLITDGGHVEPPGVIITDRSSRGDVVVSTWVRAPRR
jgi:hypothetical protein